MLNQAEALNDACDCVPLEQASVMREIASDYPDLPATTWHHDTLFAATPVFVSQQDMVDMKQLVSGIEQVIRTPIYQNAVENRSGLKGNQLSNRANAGSLTPGVMMGYDFHLTPDGPQLIEINTNAGGAFLVSSLYDTPSVHSLACPSMQCLPPSPERALDTGDVFAQSFLTEWHAAGRAGIPAHIAIVDTKPESEFLLVDMQLAQIQLQRLGATVHIVAADQLSFESSGLMYNGHFIDFVYNRLTDFQLLEPGHQAISQAWQSGMAVVSPAPDHHQLYADKRNLALFRDQGLLSRAGLAPEVAELLCAHIPETLVLDASNAEALWASRKQWYFKPATAFGSRAVYSGRKITTKKWAEILANPPYVAQKLVPPATRLISHGEKPLKFDVRLYSYAGNVQLAVARLYDGQTTNFRTIHGGFAPVMLCG